VLELAQVAVSSSLEPRVEVITVKDPRSIEAVGRKSSYRRQPSHALVTQSELAGDFGGGQEGRAVIRTGERRKVGWQVRMDELKDSLNPLEAAETVLTEIPQLGTRWK
jgi:hypothetical protein